jgi:hypothetical protein
MSSFNPAPEEQLLATQPSWHTDVGGRGTNFLRRSKTTKGAKNEKEN